MPAIAGQKWLNEADYLSQDDKQKVMDEVDRLKVFITVSKIDGKVRIRPATYIGPGSENAIATVCYTENGGEKIWQVVYR